MAIPIPNISATAIGGTAKSGGFGYQGAQVSTGGLILNAGSGSASATGGGITPAGIPGWAWGVGGAVLLIGGIAFLAIRRNDRAGGRAV